MLFNFRFILSLLAGVNCVEPVLQDGVWVRGSRPPYGFMATVTYKCHDGYKMIGDHTFSCTINSYWSPPVPKCKSKCIENDYVIMAVADSPFSLRVQLLT